MLRIRLPILRNLHSRLSQEVSWFPAYEAAKAFTEMRHSPDPILHLVHPRPAPWSTLISAIANDLGVPLVEYKKWLSALENHVPSGSSNEVEAMAANPALHLLSFFKAQEAAISSETEPMGLVKLSTEKSTQVSVALANLPELDAERAAGWVAAWKKAGFL